MKITVKVPGSCGELIQGTLNGEPFLVTCPINLYSVATVSDEFSGHLGLGWKSEAMLTSVLDYLGQDVFDFGIDLKSELPIAKGMASSSADMAAVGKAVSLTLGVDLNAEIIARLTAAIEPTDGTFYEGIVAMNPLTGHIISRLAPMRGCKIVILDFGGEVNTLDFKRCSNLNLDTFNFNWQLVTASAIANQVTLYKPSLESIIDCANAMGALAVCAAHTGTVVGVIFDGNITSAHLKYCIVTLTKTCSEVTFCTTAELISGGFYIT